MNALEAEPVVLGNPVPWFRAKTVFGAAIDLHVCAGRWVVLAFLASPADASAGAHTEARLAALLRLAAGKSDDHIIIYAIFAAPPPGLAALQPHAGPVMKFIADYEGAIARLFAAGGSPRTIVLDPMLRAVANVSCEPREEHDRVVGQFLAALPPVDQSAGVAMTAPALILPRVFETELCANLVRLFELVGGSDSGFLVERGGKPEILIDHAKKSRRDMVITAPDLRAVIRERVVKRVLPAIEMYFQFRVTHMDRYLIARYDAESGGRFFRHRDNMSPGVEHRRFALSLNLNADFEGCDLIFPEFGRRTYRPPAGGAIVFSCGALHEVTPISRGRRYAFLPFLYGEADAAKCQENDALLRGIGVHYAVAEHSLATQGK